MRNPNFAHALTRDQNAGPPLHKILNPPLDTMLSLEQALENRVHEAGLTQVLETSTKHLGVPATQRDCSCCTSTTAEIGVNFPRLAVRTGIRSNSTERQR